MNTLVPKKILRSDGVLTTVHVNPDKSKPNSSRVSKITSVASKSKVKKSQVTSTSPSSDPQKDVERTAKDFPGDLISSGGETWRISDKSSASYCKRCGNFLTLKQANKVQLDYIQCSSCKEWIDAGDGAVGVGVLREEVPLIDNPESLKDRTWFHSTNSEDWVEFLGSTNQDGNRTLVHLGSLESAEFRLEHRSEYEYSLEAGYYAPNEELPVIYNYLYEIAVKEDAKVAPEVQPDRDWNAPTTDETDREGYEVAGVTAYVNYVESPGTISLIAHPDSIEIIGVTRKRWDFGKSKWILDSETN